eukprot:TRINITY_DN13384_c0_g1_i1.p1 TRINITY_DN13384_c0_g1~~TRINITY_DN13384_c0_g1_i1.p1  ORF type:complete len:295 (-),score=55.43 TRINITY_DN13384_c0_g1_i1:349-1233(-)
MQTSPPQNRYLWLSQNCMRFLHLYDETVAEKNHGELKIPGSPAVENLLEDRDMHLRLSAGVLIWAWLIAVMEATKGGGVVNVDVAAAQYGQKLETLKCEGQGAVVFPPWVALTKVRGLPKARSLINRTVAQKNKFRKMMAVVVANGVETWDRFVSYGHDRAHLPLEIRQATPASNDALEAYLGNFSAISASLGVATNPVRTAMVAMFLHNKGTLEALALHWASVDEKDWEVGSAYAQHFKESMVEVQKWVHESTTMASTRTALRKKTALDVQDICDQHGVTTRLKPNRLRSWLR